MVLALNRRAAEIASRRRHPPPADGMWPELAVERERPSRTARVGGRPFVVLAGPTGGTRPGDLHRGRPSVAADPDQGRDDGGVRSLGHAPGLTLARVAEHVEQQDADRYLDGEYRAIKTSGATGTEALPPVWVGSVCHLRDAGSRWTGRRGEAPEAVLAQIFSCSLKHESGVFHAFSTFESGGPPSHCFSGTMPLADLVAGLNAAEPGVEALQGWPSVIRLLALEALAGRLTIRPTWVSVAGEVCSPLVREAVRAAWGIEPSEFWGCSEGTYAFPCGVGEGMHIADDLVILEPVDRQGNVVPYGQPADRVLLTNLYNLDQPLIRYDLADAMTIIDTPCPCGPATGGSPTSGLAWTGASTGLTGWRCPAGSSRRSFSPGPV